MGVLSGKKGLAYKFVLIISRKRAFYSCCIFWTADEN
jgi:hypothetical protein